MKKSKLTGGGSFDPEAKPKYFTVGGNISSDLDGISKSVLYPNPTVKIKHAEILSQLHQKGVSVFIDSGVYSLAMNEARKRKISLEQALTLNPQEIAGFERFIQTYIELIKFIEPDIWGYVEIDFGGTQSKREIRARLESEGIRPIPVYHPASDPPEYFEELASEYDRVCIGNIVQIRSDAREAILHFVWKKKAEYNPLWVHLLGYTPNYSLYTYMADSCDSLGWLAGAAYGSPNIEAGGFTLGKLGREYIYAKGDRDSYEKMIKLLQYQANMTEYSWGVIKDELQKIRL